jgi:hypothetical protein
MPYYKFSDNDIFYNRIKTHPAVNFIIWGGKVYYNNKNYKTGTITTASVLHMPAGHVSLYELNVDRPADGLIYPFITKDGSLTSFRTISTSSFNGDFAYGDIVKGRYPMTASISRDYNALGSTSNHIKALKNTLNYYKVLSPHYEYSSSIVGRDIDDVPTNLISIPSIFYGSSIKKGSVDLKFYVSGSLIAQVKDENRNGELIQTGPRESVHSGSVAGVVLYNEGFLLLTSSTTLLSSHTETYAPLGSVNPTWLNFGTTGSNTVSSSFGIDFEGTNYVPTVTMLAHAPQAALNFSNNPTFLKYTSVSGTVLRTDTTASLYQEAEYKIKNSVSSSYNDSDPTASFRRQTFISKVGIYDKDRNLIAIAKTSTPIRKREENSYTFKLKLDF